MDEFERSSGAAGAARVKVLPPEVARKIAAGEVVDRPAALVRELVDNALDAGARSVDLDLSGGGIDRLEVSDDGSGMERRDLELCWLPHATSKISQADDLLRVRTLGFRGEALSSVAAVARLEIVTCRNGEAWRLVVGSGAPGPAGTARDGGAEAGGPGAAEAGPDAAGNAAVLGDGSGAALRSSGQAHVEPYHRAQGTSVRVSGLFGAYPARRKFLKRPAAEGTLCAQALIDKALAFPAVAFRHFVDGSLKLFLPPAGSYRERFAAALLDDGRAPFLHEVAGSGEGFSFVVVVGGPELKRNDRRLQYVFANGRRIQDFGLLQALEYGSAGWFPNGSHPVGAIFLDVDPALVDFNIHPAKREARFKDGAAIHRALSAAIRDFLRRRGVAEAARANASYDEPGASLFADAAYGEGGPRGAAGREGSAAPLGAPRGDRWASDRNAPRYGDPSWSPGATGRDATGDAAGEAAGVYRAGGNGAYRQTQAHPSFGSASGEAAARTAMEALLDSPPDFAPLPGRAVAGRRTTEAPEAAVPGGGRIDAAGHRGSAARDGGVRCLGQAFGLFLVAERGDSLFLIDQHAAHERLLYDALLASGPTRQELLIPLPFTVEGEDDDAFLSSESAELEKLGIGLERSGAGDWSVVALPAGYSSPDEETVKDILELRSAGEHFAQRWLATVACRSAVKDGDYLDSAAALALAEAALALPEGRCPHGRPVYVEIRKEELLRGVRRIE